MPNSPGYANDGVANVALRRPGLLGANLVGIGIVVDAASSSDPVSSMHGTPSRALFYICSSPQSDHGSQFFSNLAPHTGANLYP